MSMFIKAAKRQLKGRLALDGPTGSGKTWTALEWATVLGKRIALIDTERGSASLYSHRFDFDTLEMQPPYEPERLIEALKAAEAEGYEVVIVDSLSHFWEGEGGVLDIVDGAAQRAQGNSFVGWKVGTPALRHLVDTLLALDAHLIVTMRSKMEYVLELNPRTGKNEPKKIGMAPVMRAGVEYEFSVIGDLDLEHRITISKSRCDVLSDMVFQPGRAAEAAETFKAWLADGEPLASRNDIDALKQRMNRLPDATRSACKNGFLEQFGRPGVLAASALPAAIAFVAEFENSTPPSSPPAGGDGASPVETTDTTSTIGNGGTEAAAGDAGDTDTSPTSPSPTEPAAAGDADAGADRITTKQAQGLHIDAAVAAKTLGHTNDHGNGDPKWAEPMLDALVLNVTGGRTSSTGDLTEAEYGRLFSWLDDVVEGRVKVRLGSLGGVELAAGNETLRFTRNPDGQLALAEPERTPA